MEAWARHVSPQLSRLLGVLGYGRVLVRGRGIWLYDSEGRMYLDALAGYGTFNLGHNHPRLLQRLCEVLTAETVHFVHTGPALGAGALGAALAQRVAPPLEITLLSSSGRMNGRIAWPIRPMPSSSSTTAFFFMPSRLKACCSSARSRRRRTPAPRWCR